MKNFPILFNFILALCALYIIASIIYFISDFPYSSYVIVSAVVPLIFLIMREIESRRFIDNRLNSFVGNLNGYAVYTKSLPGYRFVDVYNAVSSLSSQPPKSAHIESQHAESLAQIFNREFFTDANRRTKMPERIARAIGEREEGFFPVDSFWLRTPSVVAQGGVVRVRLQSYTHEVILEVGQKSRNRQRRSSSRFSSTHQITASSKTK